MRNTRFLGTTAYALYDEKGNEYIFEWKNERGEFVDFRGIVLRESDTTDNFGVEFDDLQGNKVYVSFDDMKTEIEYN